MLIIQFHMKTFELTLGKRWKINIYAHTTPFYARNAKSIFMLINTSFQNTHSQNNPYATQTYSQYSMNVKLTFYATRATSGYSKNAPLASM